MNERSEYHKNDYRTFLVLSEIEDGKLRSQREIASRLGISLGVVNSCIKNLVVKGYVQMTSSSTNRYGYLLTPKGETQRSRLAYKQFSRFNKLYSFVRQESLKLFQALKAKGVEQVSFCGIDDYAEISYVSLREAQLGLSAVMDAEAAGGRFLDMPVLSLAEGIKIGEGHILITALKKSEELRSSLLSLGANGETIYLPEN